MRDSGRLPGDDETKVSLSINEIRVLQHMAAKHSREIVAESTKDDYARRDQDRRLSRITKIEDKLAAAVDTFHKGGKNR